MTIPDIRAELVCWNCREVAPGNTLPDGWEWHTDYWLGVPRVKALCPACQEKWRNIDAY